MKGSVQKTLDRIFFRNTFDYRRASTDMASILARNITLGDLASNITNELADLSHLKRVGIVIFRNETNLVAQNFHGVRNTELGELLTASGAKLSESIKPFKEDFSVDFIQEPLGGILKEFGFKHIQPVYSKNKLLGALIIGEKKSEASINRDDFTFLQTIAGQIAVAIDNSFLYEEITQKERMKHELDIAKRIQLASLPGKVPNVEGLEISGTSIPAFEVGGDFYDYLETDNGDFMVIVGDVSGKGTSAALYMSKIQGIMRTLHEFRLSPRKLLVRTNHLLYSYLEKGYFVSSTAANFNTSTRKVQISRAGHLPLYYFSSSNNKLVKITTKGMVLGLTQDKTFERNMDEDEINYQTGDIFIFITDGIIDSKNTMMQDFGEERFIRTINNTIDMSAENIRNAIIESAKTFAGEEEQFDDMTVVVVKIIN
jgi:serine phosphatase RsbU (regulator of sigma subunit)